MENTFIAKLESTVFHPANFGEGETCLRFRGFPIKGQKDVEKGWPTPVFEIEVATSDLKCECGWLKCPLGPASGIWGALPYRTWYRLELVPDADGRSHLFPLFGEGAVQAVRLATLTKNPSFDRFCSLTRIANVVGAERSAPRSNLGHGRSQYEYRGIYVGQGMTTCLVAEDRRTPSIFLDLGGGTPLLKQDYNSKKAKLHGFLSTSGDDMFILSHWDSDHWRLLSWDAHLQQRLSWYAPDTNLSDPAFLDPFVSQSLTSGKLKLVAGDFPVNNIGNLSLSCFRHLHSKTKNYDGIYSIVQRNEKQSTRALMPGDLPYQKIAAHQGWSTPAPQFNAVVVPHHGDLASKNGLPTAAGRTATAFFSAGDHMGYNHPRAPSLKAHHRQSFKVVNCRTDIATNKNKIFDSIQLL